MTLRGVLTFALASLGIAVAASDSQAAVTMFADDEVIVASHEVIDDDLIVWSSYVRIDGVIKGDLVVLGQEVVVEGIVERDLFAVGKTVYLNGQVNDDARIAAYAVAFGENARVADDTFEASYSLETKSTAQISGTLYAASRQLLLAGPVVEDLRVRAAALEVIGLIGGDVHAVVGGLEGVTHSSFVVDLSLEIPEVDDGIRVASSAAIGGELDHRSLNPAIVESGAQITGGVRHEAWRDTQTGPIQLPSDPGGESLFGDATGTAIGRLGVLLSVGLLLAVALPSWLARRGDEIRRVPTDMVGWGVGTILFGILASLTIGAAFLLLLAIGLATGVGGLAWTAISAGGLLQMALFALFAIAVFYVAPALTCVGIGGAVLARLLGRDDDEAGVTDVMLLVAVGAVIYAILRAIPLLGWLFGLAATLIGLGAITRWFRAATLEPGDR